MALPGIGTFLGGIGAILGKASTYIPGQVEKLRNERDNLDEERRTIEILNLDIDKKSDRDKADRHDRIVRRIADIDKLLRNKAKD